VPVLFLRRLLPVRRLLRSLLTVRRARPVARLVGPRTLFRCP